MSIIEWLAAGFGIVCLVLLVRRSLWNYPFAILSVALLAWVFLHSRLYSDALLQLFFIGINLYGWANWTRSRGAAGEVVVERLGWVARAGWLIGGAAVALAWGAAMHRFTDAAYPWWDGAIAIASVAAQLLLARRLVENWWVWIAVDCAAVPLYGAKGLWAAAGLYVIYLGLSVWGLSDWHRLARAQGPVVA
jgi:nicotinamide mononucleotide transporter